MKRLFESGLTRPRLIKANNAPGGRLLPELNTEHQARSIFMDLLSGHTDYSDLRDLMSDLSCCHDLSRMSDSDVLDQLSWQLACGQIAMAEGLEEETSIRSAHVPVEKDEAEPMESKPAPTVEKSWFRLLVAENRTGQAMAGLSMNLRLPHSDETEYATDSNGMVEVNDIQPGSCQVRRELGDGTLLNTYTVVSVSRKAVEKKDVEMVHPGDDDPELAMIRPYRVRKGDSLESVAADAGLAWQDLAHFNWGTSNPDEINEHLRDKVGCRRRSRDGQNYIFDNDDTPGILHIPYPVSKTGIYTDGTYYMRVQPVPVLSDYAFERKEDQIALSFAIQGSHPKHFNVRVYECCNMSGRRRREALIRRHAGQWEDREGYRKSGTFVELGADENLATIADRFGFSRPDEIFEHFLNDELRDICPRPGALQEGDSLYIPQMKTQAAIPLGPLLEVEETDESVPGGKRYEARWDINDQGYDLLDPERWMPETRADLRRPGNWMMDGNDRHGASQYLPQFAVVTVEFEVLGVSPPPMWLVNEAQVEKPAETERLRVFMADGRVRDADGNGAACEPYEEPFAFFGAQTG